MSGYKVVPMEPTPEMVKALKARLIATSRGGILNSGHALTDAIAAAPAVQGEPIGWRWFVKLGGEVADQGCVWQKEKPDLILAHLKDGCTAVEYQAVYGRPPELAVQGESVAVPDALRQIADWMDDGGPTRHEAEMIGMEISGPVECSSHKQCTKAAKKAFLEAARIWEHMHPAATAEQQPAPDVAGLAEALEARRDDLRWMNLRHDYQNQALGEADALNTVPQPAEQQTDVTQLVEALEAISRNDLDAQRAQHVAAVALAAHRKGGDV